MQNEPYGLKTESLSTPGTTAPAAAPDSTTGAAAAPAVKVRSHAIACGEVGETGDHGDLGSNAFKE